MKFNVAFKVTGHQRHIEAYPYTHVYFTMGVNYLKDEAPEGVVSLQEGRHNHWSREQQRNIAIILVENETFRELFDEVLDMAPEMYRIYTYIICTRVKGKEYTCWGGGNSVEHVFTSPRHSMLRILPFHRRAILHQSKQEVTKDKFSRNDLYKLLLFIRSCII